MNKLKYPISVYAVAALYPVLFLFFIKFMIPGTVQLDHNSSFMLFGMLLLFLAACGIIAFSVSVAGQMLSSSDRKPLLISFAMLIPFILFSMFIPSFGNPVRLEKERRAACEENIRQIYFALYNYAADNKGFFPNKAGVNGIRMLRDLRYLSDTDVCRCPSAEHTNGGPELTEDRISYDYIGGHKKSDDHDTLILMDKDGNHGKHYRNAVTVTGDLRRIRE